MVSQMSRYDAENSTRAERTVRVLYAQPDNRSFYEEYIRLGTSEQLAQVGPTLSPRDDRKEAGPQRIPDK